MDYNGSIEAADQRVVLALYDVARARRRHKVMMAWPLLANERRRWTSRQERVDYLLSCRNENFHGSEQTALLGPSITYEVQAI